MAVFEMNVSSDRIIVYGNVKQEVLDALNAVGGTYILKSKDGKEEFRITTDLQSSYVKDYVLAVTGTTTVVREVKLPSGLTKEELKEVANAIALELGNTQEKVEKTITALNKYYKEVKQQAEKIQINFVSEGE